MKESIQLFKVNMFPDSVWMFQLLSGCHKIGVNFLILGRLVEPRNSFFLYREGQLSPGILISHRGGHMNPEIKNSHRKKSDEPRTSIFLTWEVS